MGNVRTNRYDRWYLYNTSIKDYFFTFGVLLANLWDRAMNRFTVFIFEPTSSASQRVTFVFIAYDRMNYKQASMRRKSARTLNASRCSIYSPFTKEGWRYRARSIDVRNCFAVNNVYLFRGLAVIFRTATNVKMLGSTNGSFQDGYRFLMVSCLSLRTLQGNTNLSSYRVL